MSAFSDAGTARYSTEGLGENVDLHCNKLGAITRTTAFYQVESELLKKQLEIYIQGFNDYDYNRNIIRNVIIILSFMLYVFILLQPC